MGNITARKHIITRAKDQRMAYFTLVLIGQKNRNMQSKITILVKKPLERAIPIRISQHSYILVSSQIAHFTFFIGIQQQQSTIKVIIYIISLSEY